MSSILSSLTLPLVQSPYLFLQAAGSDGVDGTTQGIHTRWTFLRALGDNHLPKGHLTESGTFASTADYNKANDFVELYKIPYDILYKTIVDFNVAPGTLVESGTTRYWTYSITVMQDISSTLTPTSTVNAVQVRFTDVSIYDTVRASIDPSTDTLDFMMAYSGVVEVELLGKLQFAVDFTLTADATRPDSPGILRTETISLSENIASEPTYVSCRHKFVVTGEVIPRSGPLLDDNTAMLVPVSNPPHKMLNDNIKYVRFSCYGQVAEKVVLESYQDFIEGRTDTDWTHIDDFALSLTDSEVYDRLDGPGLNINGNWPKYKGAVTGGKFTVRTDNYKDRWLEIPSYYAGNTDPDQHLKQAVTNYLDLSKLPGNPSGLDTINLTGPGMAQFDISYVDMLRVASLDYHVARMLGLGYIDAGNYTTPYIYLTKYITQVALEPSTSAFTQTHLYMSLPTTINDKRKCIKPNLQSLTYGLTVDNGTDDPIQLTDENGYSLNDPSRYICLNREPIELLREMKPFFDTPEEFCFGESTLPVLYGLVYKGHSEIPAREPELSHDPIYVDLGTVAETIGVLERDGNPIYMHRETENGAHDYAIYGVNWFSRASTLSNILTTDVTTFQKLNTILPPLNFACQLIQSEDPLLFTSSREQTRLTNYIATSPPDNDYTIVRVTFEWNHLHNIAYQYADKVQFFFRENVPSNVRGKVKSTIDLANNRVEVHTESFPNDSSPETPKPTIDPFITPGQESHYLNGIFSTGDDQFIVENVYQSGISGEGVIFILRKSRKMETSFATVPSQPQETFYSPAVGSQFIAIENMADPGNWTDLHTFEVNLQDFGSTYTETVTYPDGTTRILPIGGIYEQATVNELTDYDPDGNPITNSGVYKIIFNSYTLLETYQTDVEWVGGTVRIIDTNPSTPDRIMRELHVVSIKRDSSGAIVSPLEISAFDPLRNDTSSGPAPYPIQTGVNVNVNFHPGYRAYMYAITTSGSNFIDNIILPAQGDGSKYTYMASRAIDSVNSVESSLTSPATLFAREIVPPSVVGLPSGPLYATRPDFYGKSSYTFDVQVDLSGGREPFALVFYRSAGHKLLDRLYKPTTVDAIYAALAALSTADAAFDQNRWNDLANGNYDTGTGQFLDYLGGTGYRFPAPDNDDYRLPDLPAEQPFLSGTLQPGDTFTFVHSTGSRAMIDIIKRALLDAFIPLTEQPVLYSKIRSGTTTLSKKPVLRDLNGDLLPHDNPDYDPAPMAVKYSDQVRFSDYNLDGASTDIYFYFAKEMTNDLKFGPPSTIAGPVHLVNAAPPESPKIRKVTSRLADPPSSITTGVVMEINQYPVTENVNKVRILRGNSETAITSVRTMTAVADVDVSAQVGDDQFVITDDFSDVPFPPYGDPLFYRIVALRTILNEQGVPEDVPSRPSNVVMASIVDVENPPSPEITLTYTAITSTQIIGATLNWSTTCYNGTYRLYKMTTSGNWQKIYEVKTNNPVSIDLALTDLLSNTLQKVDSDGNTMFHSFRVQVENSSGLLNLDYNQLTI